MLIVYCWCHSVSASVLLYFTFLSHLFPLPCGVQFPARGSTQVLLCLFPGVLWLWHFLYSVGPHPVSTLHIYTFVVSRAFMAGAASQAGDADSTRAPGLTSGLQGSTVVLYCWCHSDSASVLLYFTLYILVKISRLPLDFVNRKCFGVHYIGQ